MRGERLLATLSFNPLSFKHRSFRILFVEVAVPVLAPIGKSHVLVKVSAVHGLSPVIGVTEFALL